MKRTKIPIKDIKPNEYNPNVIQKVEYEHLKTKIRNSGFYKKFYCIKNQMENT